MSYFGTDGIRKKANEFTPELLRAIAKGVADYGEFLKPDGNFKVLIGGDTRESSEVIIAELETAFESLGVEFGTLGIFSTPGISYVFFEMGFDFAIDVTASHNPWTDNGIKIFERGKNAGMKLSDKGREFIDAAIDAKLEYPIVSVATREDLHDEALEIYKEHLRSFVKNADFSGLKIGLDCANGATSIVGGDILKECGAEVIEINRAAKYGREINNNCGSTHLEALKDLVLKEKLDFGAAFDGDGDRILMIDKNGEVVDGDQLIVILADALGLDSIALTVMSNQGAIDWAKKAGVKLEITAVGDENVAKVMREKGIKIGGEQSGHVILPGEATGDGIATALCVTKIIAESGEDLNKLAKTMTRFPQVMINLEADQTQKSHLNEASAQQIITSYTKKMADMEGRLLVRPSGTENLIRITMWGDDEEKIATLANELAEKLKGVL